MSLLNEATGEVFEVHPVADLFPMLLPDEMADLAADIAERGLVQSVVLDAEGRVLDGRNRLTACWQAGVEATFEKYEGDDPDGYALAVNLARRHMTKGQQAMVAARALILNIKGTQTTVAKAAGVSQPSVGHAAVVLEHAPDLADAVVAGATSLNDAYRIARDRKQAAESAQKQLADLPADLAVMVREETLTLDGARGEAQARETKAREEQRDARSLLDRIVDLTLPSRTGPLDDDFIEAWASRLSSVNPITDDDPDIETTIDLTIQTLTQLKGYIR